jgi:Protein of unknown function (DUF3800)
MYLLYCDESNLQKKDYDFFVYGGLVVEGQAAHLLSLEIDKIRKKMNISKDFLLKFNPGPPSLDHRKFITVKEEIIKAAISYKCIFLTSLILHNVATSPDVARRKEINRICLHYDRYIERLKSHGLVLIDRFEDKEVDAHLREKFSIGITGPDLPFSKEFRLKNIAGFHYAAIGQSHFVSITDIILGSFRFAINAFTRKEEEKLATAGHILKLLSPLFYRKHNSKCVSELSLFFSPKDVKITEYRNMYKDLASFLSENGIPVAQKFAKERV